MKPGTFIGVDPDLRACPVALISDGKLQDVFLFRPEGEKALKGKGLILEMVRAFSVGYKGTIHAFAVESQNVNYAGRTNSANPQDVADLGNISGAAACCMFRASPGAMGYLPDPSTWKGSEPKHINQARTFQRLGISFKTRGITVGKDGLAKSSKGAYCHPVEKLFGLNDGDWKDAADAVGLALYAMDEFNKAK